MLPGSRPEDIAAEYAEVGLCDMLNEAGLYPEEYMIVAQVGLAAVMAARGYAKYQVDEALANEAEARASVEFPGIHYEPPKE